eukprot:jgi/Hompol1/4013/HPOL_006892-RA
MASKLPPGCTLFIGNLQSGGVSRVDIAKVFAVYGNILEISFKKGLGFVIYDNPESCKQAVAKETRCVINGVKLHIKVAKEKGTKRPEQPKPADRNRGRDNVRDRDEQDEQEKSVPAKFAKGPNDRFEQRQ